MQARANRELNKYLTEADDYINTRIMNGGDDNA